MRKGRFSRVLSIIIGMTMIVAMLNVFPFTAQKLNAAALEADKGVCYISFSERDVDSVKAQIVTKNFNSGEIVTAYFNMTIAEIVFGSFPEGASLDEYNSQTGRLIVSIKGKNGNPNGSYSFQILGTGIKNLNAKLQMVTAKPGEENGGPGQGPGGGPAGPGEGPGGGPAGPGEGPGGGPAGPGEGPAGPGKDDPKKQEETQATSVTNTPTPTPAPTSTPVPTPTTAPTAASTTSSETKATTKPAENTTAAATEATTTATETTLPETSEETTSEETSETAPVIIAPAEVETEPSATDPTESGTGETTVDGAGETTVVAAASKVEKESSGSSSFIWLLLLLILLILAYLRYRHLKKKGMTNPEILKNFIPIPALIEKIKGSKKSSDYELDGPQPEVMNGYLQKPTVGLAAAQAIRPVRSNTTSQPSKPHNTAASSKPASANGAAKPSTASSAKAPVAKPGSSGSSSGAGRSSRVTPKDPELHEMELRQRELEQKMKELSSQKEKLPDIGEE